MNQGKVLILLTLLRHEPHFQTHIVGHTTRLTQSTPASRNSSLLHALSNVPDIPHAGNQSHLVCNGCRSTLLYPHNASRVRCQQCGHINHVAPTPATSHNNHTHSHTTQSQSTSQIYCSNRNCRVLLMYPQGASSVHCSLCGTVTPAHAQLNCRGCRTLLLYPLGAHSVKCTICQHISPVYGAHNSPYEVHHQQHHHQPSSTSSYGNGSYNPHHHRPQRPYHHHHQNPYYPPYNNNSNNQSAAAAAANTNNDNTTTTTNSDPPMQTVLVENPAEGDVVIGVAPKAQTAR
jgi:LSD1 subclass zinc finger protein